MGVKNTVKNTAKKIYHLKYRQIKLFIGRKPANSIELIVRFYGKEGLMSMLYKAIGQVEFAERNGWGCYIDTEHFDNMYRVKGKNSWESFFSQPKINKLSGKDKKNYIISDPGGKVLDGMICGEYWAYSFEKYKEKGELFNRYFDINAEIAQAVDNYVQNLGIDKCVGVYCRGTDYTALKPKSHPVQPTVQEVTEVVQQFIDREDSKIFLVTEDAKIKQHLTEKFGDRVLTIEEDLVFDSYENGKMLADVIDENNKINAAKIYLIKILCLARCKRLVASKTNGSLMAMIFNGEKYEECYLFEKGLY